MNPNQAHLEEARVELASPRPRSLRRLAARVVLWSLPILVLGEITGFNSLLELPLRCVFGWVLHLWVTLPVLLPQWRGLLLPLFCLAIALWFGHGFIRWAMAAKGGTKGLRLSQTAAIFGLLLLGSAAAIAMSGVVHELAWLSKEPLTEDRGRTKERMTALLQIKNVVDVLWSFESEKGRYPDSLEELAEFEPRIEKSSWIPVGIGRAKEKLIYLKPPAGGDEKEPVPILFSPPLPPDSHVMVGHKDGATRVIGLEKLNEILQARTGHGN